MGNYVRILLKEFYTEIKLEIMDCHKATYMDDTVVDTLLKSAVEEGEVYENQY
jgi:hypothetical protein